MTDLVAVSDIALAMLEVVPAIIGDLDTGEIVYATAPAEFMFGYLVNELAGKNVDDLVPLKLKSAHKEYRTDYAVRPRARQMGPDVKLMGRRQDGTEIPVSIGLFPRVIAKRRCCIAIIVDLRPYELGKN